MDRTLRTAITRYEATPTHTHDEVVLEEPLEIRVNDKAVSVTMRTPGDDFELAAGLLFTEGLIKSADEIGEIRHWGSPNVVRVATRAQLDLSKLQRHFYATSSCGVCGKASIDAIRVQTSPVVSAVRISAEVVAQLPDRLRAAQPAFDATGGLHAAGIFTPAGQIVDVREDVGRHNAVDKVVGARFLAKQPIGEVLVLSGRAGFEVMQKAAVAGIAIVAAVGAPSSLAVELARELDLTLAGFVRGGRFNVYAGEKRVT